MFIGLRGDNFISSRFAQAHSTEREFCTAMDAEIEPAMNALRRTPQNHIPAKKPCGKRAAQGNFAGPCNQKPLGEEKRIVERCGLSCACG